MLGGRERRHIETDLGDQHLRGRLADTRDGHQPTASLIERDELAVDLLVDAGDRRVEMVDIREMQPQHRAVMVAEPAESTAHSANGAPERISRTHTIPPGG